MQPRDTVERNGSADWAFTVRQDRNRYSPGMHEEFRSIPSAMPLVTFRERITHGRPMIESRELEGSCLDHGYSQA
jgi:hypothetical protein